MPRKKKESIPKLYRSSRVAPADQGFYNPFTELDQQARGHSSPPVPPKGAPGAAKAAASAPEADESSDDSRLFREAMSGVRPLSRGSHGRVPPAPPARSIPRFRMMEEMEAYASLAELTVGEGGFELTYSDEYVVGAVDGLSPATIRKLRNGDFSYQDHVDLHGCNVDRAYDLVVDFMRRSYGYGRRCVLIIPGRGLNSAGRMPVLKNNLVQWLTHAPLNRMVLAFASARSCDGGVGALYVLMRRNPGKGRFVIPIV